MGEMVANSKEMTEEERKEILRIIGEKYDEQIRKTEEGHKKILEILETAKNENRDITDAERNEINTIKDEMKGHAIRLLRNSRRKRNHTN